MAVAFSGQASGTTSATLPTHATGDLIVCFGYRDAATAFTVPAGWTQLDLQQGGALSHWGGLFYKVAASSSETSGTWTNASQVLFHVYTGAEVGAWSRNTGTTLTFNFAALTFNVGDGTSWAAGFVGYRNSDTTLESPPTGMTNRSNQVTATPSSESAGHDTNGGVTGWASTNQTVTGTAGGWITYVLELKAAGSGAQTITAALVTNTQTFYGATVGAGAVDIAGALTTNAQTFYGATVAASYAVTGGTFDNSQTFYQATVSPGPVTVSGALYTNAQTFPAATVSQDGSTQAITADLVANAQAFFGATVTAIAPRRTGGFGGRIATKRDHDEQRKRLKEALRKEAETVALLDQAYDRAHGIAKAAFQAMDVPVPDVIPAKVRDIVRDMPDRVTTALVNNLLKAIAAYQRQQMEEEEAMILLLLAA